MSDASVALLGVKGGPAIKPGSNMPCSNLVQIAGKNIVVDAGLGVCRGICDQGVELNEIDMIIITHLHSDHYLELGPLFHTAWTAGLNKPIKVIGPKTAAKKNCVLAKLVFQFVYSSIETDHFFNFQ